VRSTGRGGLTTEGNAHLGTNQRATSRAIITTLNKVFRAKDPFGLSFS